MNTRRWSSMVLVVVCTIAGVETASARLRGFAPIDAAAGAGAIAQMSSDASPPTPPPATSPPAVTPPVTPTPGVVAKPPPPKSQKPPQAIVGTPPAPIQGGK
jgi:hypothetical protein